MAKFKSSEFINHLKSKWQGRPCPLCGVGNWNVSDTVYEFREFRHGDFVIGGVPIVPVIPVTCNNCGNTILVNAIVSGAVEPPKQEKEEKNGK